MQFDVLMFGEMRERKMANGTCVASVARWPFGREEELGAWCLVPGIWYLVLGTWYKPHKKGMKKDPRPYRPQGDGV